MSAGYIILRIAKTVIVQQSQLLRLNIVSPTVYNYQRCFYCLKYQKIIVVLSRLLLAIITKNYYDY